MSNVALNLLHMVYGAVDLLEILDDTQKEFYTHNQTYTIHRMYYPVENESIKSA